MDASTGQRVRAAVLVLGIACASVLSTASPAAAHGPGGLQPTNYQTRVTHLRPRITGVSVHPVDLGAKLELTNTSGRDVTVLGYDHEPYLRVGPRGVFENRRSPATFLNRSTRITKAVPSSADPQATPEWRRISDGPSVSWHEHRAHWMGSQDPPQVQRARGVPHLVQRFHVELLRDDTPIVVSGDVRWIPGPSPWPWIAGALVLGIVVLGVSRTRRWGRVLGTALVVLLGAQIVHVVGLWGASTASSGSRLVASAYAFGGMALALGALVVLVRQGPHAAVPLALLAGLAMTLAGGLADVTTFTRSQVPTTTPVWLDRLTVAVTLGVGAAVIGAAALRLPTRTRTDH